MVVENIGEPLAALGRLIANEEATSDLLSLLIELDDKPLIEVFSLPGDCRYEARREISTRNGRLDIVIVESESERPVAVLEMKGASDIHGDQLERYFIWASHYESQPQLVLCAFDNEEASASSSWTRCRLRDVFSVWQQSTHEHAAWLAQEIVGVLEKWDREADGPLGARTGYYVADIVSKRLARDVSESLDSSFTSKTHVGAFRDKGGSPMILAWAAHPRDRTDETVAVGVDLRSPVRRSKSTIWKLRPHVEVDVTSERNLEAARRLAFELAQQIHGVMGREHISNELVWRGQDAAASALSARNNDGFNKSPENFDFESWTERINGESRYPRSGIFFHDKGRRLSTVLDLDVSTLTRHDLKNLVVSIIDILNSAAQSTYKG